MKKKLLPFLLLIAICQMANARQYPVKAGHKGYYEVDHELTEYFMTTSSQWYVEVVKVADSSLQLNCTLLHYKRDTKRVIPFDTRDSLWCQPYGSRDLVALCLLNKPVSYLLTSNPETPQPDVMRLWEPCATAWLSPDYQEKMRIQPLKYLKDEIDPLFPYTKGAGSNAGDNATHVKVIPLSATQVKKHLLSDDFINAVVKASYSSQALVNTGNEIEPSKMQAYFTQYDPLFTGRPFYQVIKLDLLNRNAIKNGYAPYRKLLLQTPDAWLKGKQMHLSNKMQNMTNATPDEAYGTLVCLSEIEEGLSSWVQSNFARQFKPGVKRTILFDELLSRAVQAPEVALREETQPLYLWVTAGRAKDSLLWASGQLASLAAQKRGNVHRYALLVYKQLKAAGYDKEAASLLEKHRVVMEERVADAADLQRYQVKNMLAYLYKLKSEWAQTRDTAQYMNYLAKAASFSPQSNVEKIYESHHDREFLESQESYRKELVEALTKGGRTEEGIRQLVELLKTDPLMIKELQSCYTNAYPQHDFYTFLQQQVISGSWKKAPEFSLKSPDAQTTHTLADYKGKWLLIDFWGTWCLPCRSEMPQVNKFVKKIADRKDLAFLSIASRDTPEAVTKYLAANQFYLPVTMSDDKVDKEYEVTGYPGKFLVSPSGYVLPIHYGLDWEQVVNLFTSIQPGGKG